MAKKREELTEQQQDFFRLYCRYTYVSEELRKVETIITNHALVDFDYICADQNSDHNEGLPHDCPDKVVRDIDLRLKLHSLRAHLGKFLADTKAAMQNLHAEWYSLVVFKREPDWLINAWATEHHA